MKCICLTDAIFASEWAAAAEERGVRVRNWICSKSPLDEEVMGSGWKVSAGTDVHENSSHSALHSIIRRIEECFMGGGGEEE